MAGRTSGLMELGEAVTWEATHFCVRQQLSVQITQFDRPRHFRDSMLSGVFQRFDHDHFFSACDDVTTMEDVFKFQSPLGVLGHVANWLLVTRHLRRLLIERNQIIKTVAESGDVERFLVTMET